MERLGVVSWEKLADSDDDWLCEAEEVNVRIDVLVSVGSLDADWDAESVALQESDSVTAIEIERRDTDSEKLWLRDEDCESDACAVAVPGVGLSERDFVKLGDFVCREGVGFVWVA
jgi:hypothetical protein